MGNSANAYRFPWEYNPDPSGTNPSGPSGTGNGGGGFDGNGDPRHGYEYGGGGPGPGFNGPGGNPNDAGVGDPGGPGTGQFDFPMKKQNKFLKRQARTTGYQSLLDILNSNGSTDPARLALQFQGIDRGTEANQQATTGRLAGAGLEGSALGQALQAAIGQSGVGQKSEAQANENAIQEERRRQDLGLLLQLIINPGLQKRGQDKALQAALASRQKNGFDFGGILSALGPLLSGLGSGNSTTGDTTGSGTGTGTNGPANNDAGGVGGYGGTSFA